MIDEYYDGSAQSNKEAIAAQLDDPALIAAAAVRDEEDEEAKKRKQDIVVDEDTKRFKASQEADV